MNPMPHPNANPDAAAAISARGLRLVSGAPARDFDLRSGTAVFLEESADTLAPGAARWLDLLLGLEIPDPDECGEVLWRGRPWAEIPPDDASAARGECGVVPAGGGLLTNLDMDENAWLPALWHRRENAGEELAKWAAFFGCNPLPQARAHAVAPGVRRRIAWTRAFAGRPALLVLEDALGGVAPADRNLLLDACRCKLAEGAAIAWIAPSLDPDVAAALDVDPSGTNMNNSKYN
jgi:ABC-type lipoprotein export system ATPase subunit